MWLLQQPNVRVHAPFPRMWLWCRPDTESELEPSDERGEIQMVLGLFGDRRECACHPGDSLRCTDVDTGKGLPEKSWACGAVTGSLQRPSLVLENEIWGPAQS